MITIPRRRDAFTLLELAITAALLAVLLTFITQTLAAVERQMRRTDERALALRTVENLMEQCTRGDWDEINDARIRELTLPAGLRRRWPRAQLAGEVVLDAEPVAGKRVTLSLQSGTATRDRPVTLTTWIYQSPED